MICGAATEAVAGDGGAVTSDGGGQAKRKQMSEAAGERRGGPDHFDGSDHAVNGRPRPAVQMHHVSLTTGPHQSYSSLARHQIQISAACNRVPQKRCNLIFFKILVVF